MGIRFLDLRVKKKKKKLILVHGALSCYENDKKKNPLTLDKVISDCRKFLSANPTETVFFSLKRDDGVSSEETFDFFSENYIKNDAFWYLEDRIPTLEEVRGQIVLFNRCAVDFSNNKNGYTDYNTGLDFSHLPDQSKVDFTGFETAFMHHRITGGKEKYYLQDMYKLSPRQKWKNGVLPALESDIESDVFALNFLSANKLPTGPKGNAKYVNKKLGKYPLQASQKYGILIMDYPSESLCRKIVLTNF
jgi:1-phosphatidylinositol phosphodiesterase